MTQIVLKNYILLSQEEHIQLLEIRNQEQIRESSLSGEVIPLQQHLVWVEQLKENKNKKFYAIILKGKIIGGIHIFNLDHHPTWGIFFDERTDILIKSVVALYFIEHLFKAYKLNTLHSKILSHNANAISFNKTLGFKENAIINDIIKMKLHYNDFNKKKQGLLLKPLLKKIQLFDFVMQG